MNIVFDPYADIPMSISKPSGETIFSIQVQEDDEGNGETLAIVKGRGGVGFINQTEGLSLEVRKALNRYYHQGDVTIAPANYNQSSGVDNSLTRFSVTTEPNNHSVSIAFNFADSGSYVGSTNQNYGVARWRVDISRNNVGGERILEKWFEGTASNVFDGTNWHCKYDISCVGGYVDDLANEDATNTYSISILKMSGTGDNTPTTITRVSASVSASNFDINSFYNSSSNNPSQISWTDKDTGFTIKAGVIFGAATGLFYVNYNESYTQSYVSIISTEYDDSVGGNANDTYRIALNNLSGGTMNIEWMTMGYTAV